MLIEAKSSYSTKHESLIDIDLFKAEIIKISSLLFRLNILTLFGQKY